MFLFIELKCVRFAIPNGKVKFGHLTFNMKVNISCKDGFHLQGPSVVTCGPEGYWTPALPSCEQGKTLLDSLYDSYTVQYYGLPFALCRSDAQTAHMPAPSRAQQHQT